MNHWLHLSWLDGDVSYRLVVTLLHFVWQAAILGVVAHVVTCILERRNARHAYGVNVAFLTSMVLVAVFTFALVRAPQSVPPQQSAAIVKTMQPATVGPSKVVKTQVAPVTSSSAPTTPSRTSRNLLEIRHSLSRWSSPLAQCYLIAVGLMFLRIGHGMWKTNTLRWNAIPIARSNLLQTAKRTADRIGLVTTPALAWCEETSTPIVVGLLRPMILLPAAMIGGLTTQQLESILAHEMAHIRRFDIWVSLLQRIIESAFFFHPAVWFVSRQVDIEREKVADDVALRAGCDPTEFADSLLRMAELSAELRANLGLGDSRLTQASGFESSSLAMTGHRPSALKCRVLRLLRRDSKQTIHTRPTFPAVSATIAVTLILTTTAITVNGVFAMNTNSNDEPSQVMRDTFAAAIKANDLEDVEKLLMSEPTLANADLRDAERRNVFSNGHPLHRACEQNHDKLAELLLKHGSNPDAPGPDPEDRPVHGMPLHWAAAEHQNYKLANMLLDNGATPNSYPNCDKATIERMFYHAREAGVSNALVRRSFAKFLPDQAELESQTASELAGKNSAEAIMLFARMVDLGGQPPFTALVREGFDDLLFEMVENSKDEDGTPHDHPNSKVLDNIAGASRWYGYPQLVRRLMEHPSYEYSYEGAISTISVAIGSHNRDGDYAKYREIIVMQLEALKSNGDLEKARADYRPLHEMATDFTWHENYGYRADIAKPESFVDLAELFVSWGFDEINHVDAETKHSPLSAAVKRGHHPGVATYVQWLLDKGADLRSSDPDNVNPLAIAKEKGLVEIQQILEKQE